jgi:tRNA(His) 5'-end guanylyltransferase
MKGYEAVSSNKLMRRTPVIIRLDGKAFHTYTKSIKNAFDGGMHLCMVETMIYLCENIQGAVLGYTQSDEITILLKDWQTHETQAWFDNKQTKMESISASMATAKFNEQAKMILPPNVSDRFALFDSRAFNVPVDDVTNCFLWRQQDASRNSVQMLGRMHFSNNEMQNKNNSQVQDMLMLQKGVNWNDLDTWKKRGICWKNGELDQDIPIFSKDRGYIEELL